MITQAVSRVALCLLTAAPAVAQLGINVSNPRLANFNGGLDAGDDSAPVVVSNGADVWTCVYVSNDTLLTGGGDTDVFWVRSRDSGVTWSAPAPIFSGATSDSGPTSVDIQPALATDGVDRVVVWASSSLSPTGQCGIHAATSNSQSTSWSNVQPVSSAFSTDAVEDRNPCIAGANDTFVTVWEREGTGSERDLWFSRTSVFGTPVWSAPARLNPGSATDVDSETHPSIATDGQGHWVVVYEAPNSQLGTGADSEIWAYRSIDDGVNWVGPALVNATAAPDGGAHDSEPALAVDRPSGTWVCAWRTLHTFGNLTGGDAEIAFAKSTQLGAGWQPVGILNSDFATDQTTSPNDSDPFVGTDHLGRVIISWTRTTLNAADTDLRAVRSDDLCATWTVPEFIDIEAVTDTGADASTALAADGNGHWVCVWQSNDRLGTPIGPDLDVFASRILIPAGHFLADVCYGYVEPGYPARCPCANDSSIGSHQGCLNSTGSGAQLGMFGPFSASAPSQFLSFANVPPTAPVLMFQGTGLFAFGTGTPLGDGMLCVGGTLTRLGVAFANGSGNGSLNFAPVGVVSGDIRFYQGWYRDSAAFCTSATFNLTNAFGTVWAP
jgi:hypothetical protein